MEIRFTIAQALFGAVFGIVLAHWFGAPWWGYIIAIPAAAALAYYFSLRRLRALDLKPDALFVDYIEAWRKRWRR